MKKRNHVANWLSNLSVGTIAVGAFQTVNLIPQISGESSKWIALVVGLVLFGISYFLKEEDA